MGRLAATLLVSVATTGGCTAHNPHYMPQSMGCSLGERTCSGSRPVECLPIDNGTALRNALCPTAGTCDNGHCAPPADQKPCKRERDCSAAETCTAFVNSGGAVATFCVAPEGITAGPNSCSAPAQCRSNLCLATMQASKSVCFLACDGDGDCPPAMKCRKYAVTVSGVQGTIDGCGPT